MCFLSPLESPVTGSIPSVPGVPVNSTHRLPMEGGENGIMKLKAGDRHF